MTKINIELDTTDIIEAVRKDVVDGLAGYSNIDAVIEAYLYNNDIVGKSWVKDELSKVQEAVRKDVVDGLSDYVSDQIDNIDWDMMVRDYGNVDTIIEDHIYNNDIVDKCYVEEELCKIHRDIRDEVLSDIRTEIESAVYHSTNSLQDQLMSLGAEVDYLHEKYRELYNKSLAGRVFTITEWLSSLTRRFRKAN